MRVFKTRWFVRFARKEGLTNHKLAEAIREIESGLYEADLGGDLIKKRVARTGEGKRGGYRTIIAYRKGNRAVFLYGFAKNEMANIGARELQHFQKLARLFIGFSTTQIETAIKGEELQEIPEYGEEVPQ